MAKLKTGIKGLDELVGSGVERTWENSPPKNSKNF